MAIKSEAGIYKILEDILRETKVPLTCVDLYDRPEVRKHARDTNKVSDFLGHMWRRGLLQRWYAAKDSTAKARFAYTWLEQNEEPKKVERLLTAVQSRTHKPNCTITEGDNCVILDFDDFTITVQSKR